MKVKERYNILQKALGLLRGDFNDLGVVAMYAAGMGVCSLAVPIAVQSLVSTVAFGSIVQPIVMLTIIVAGVLAFSGVMRLLQLWAVEVIQRRLMVRFSLTLAEKLPTVSINEFSKKYGPDYILRFLEVFDFQKLLTILLIDGVAAFFQITVGLVLVSFYHPLFLAFAIILIILILIIVFVLGIGGITTSIQESNAKYDVVAWLQDIVTVPLLFKSKSGEGYAINRTDELVSKYLNYRADHFKVLLRQNFSAIILQVVANSLLLGLGGWLVIKGQLTLGQLVAAELIFGMILASVFQIGKHLERIYDVAASVEKLDAILDLPFENLRGALFGIPERAVEVAVKNLTIQSKGFVVPLLKDVSFHITPGEKVLIYGSNGEGKSLLADMLYGLEKPYLGRLEIDGHNVMDIHPSELRTEVALIRGADLVHASIEENLLLGRTGVTHEEIRAALKTVMLEEDIYGLRNGIHTVLSGAGLLISEGQALRLVIARGILSGARFLIIDGTLDSIDDDAQFHILKELKKPDFPMTVLILTHEKKFLSFFEKKFIIQDGLLTEG